MKASTLYIRGDNCWSHCRAQQSLIDACHQITLADIPSLEVSFSGLSHFKNKVLYIDPVKDAHYTTLARIAGRRVSVLALDVYDRCLKRSVVTLTKRMELRPQTAMRSNHT